MADNLLSNFVTPLACGPLKREQEMFPLVSCPYDDDTGRMAETDGIPPSTVGGWRLRGWVIRRERQPISFYIFYVTGFEMR
jgi:hypothetical protein